MFHNQFVKLCATEQQNKEKIEKKKTYDQKYLVLLFTEQI